MQTAYFSRFHIDLPEACVADCSHSDQCHDDVVFWSKKINLDHIDNQTLGRELKDYGCWSNEELEDRQANLERILWIAACNIKEESREEITEII